MMKKIKVHVKKFNLTIEYGKADTWGIGAALVFKEALVLAIGLLYVEIAWGAAEN